MGGDVRALVLSGGGAKGAYEVGLVSKLMELEPAFDIVCGTSIGALNAAMIAQDKVPQLVELWNRVSQLDVLRPSPHVERWHQAYECGRAAQSANWFTKVPSVIRFLWFLHAHADELFSRKSLLGLTGVIDHVVTQNILENELRFTDLKRVLVTSACNLTVRREDSFYFFPPEYAHLEAAFFYEQLREHRKPIPFNPEGFAEFVRASGAIPCAFSPVLIASEWEDLAKCDEILHHYVDGAVTNNTPISQAIDAGARDITIVYVDPPSPTEPQAVDNLSEILLGALSVMRQRILDLDYQTALRVNDAKHAGAENAAQKHSVRLRKFRPEKPLRASLIAFNDEGALEEAFETGVADAASETKRNAYVDRTPVRIAPDTLPPEVMASS
ncbi:MAG: patatin-like phospholipase family protein [Candidatus Lustribacter sp.]|jgi:predicted acylesterase/phospholipase RssA